MKILLLEDDLELCSLIQSQLTKNGYMVDACNDGEAAMLYALHTDYSYDLAIVDRMLPVIDGLTIIRSSRYLILSTSWRTHPRLEYMVFLQGI